MDVMHMHKIMGFGCLAHYGVRFYWKFKYGSMFFGPNDISPLIHLGLSLSSFLFKVPTLRLSSKAIIWKELQLHNIIFTSRSVMMMYHSMLFKELNYLYYFVRLGIVGLHHYLADVVSDRYQNNDKTTTRDIPHNIDNKIIIDANKKFYAISQIAATSTLLISSNPDNGFVIMFPIQFSTFLMTLVRKGFISNNQWHIFYSLSLALPYIINYNMISVNNNKLYINIFHVILRLMLRTNKFFNFAMVTILYKFVKFSF
jgi:hypothetical protein